MSEPADGRAGGRVDGGRVDADLHMQHAGMDVIAPYVDDAWRQYLGLDEDLSAHSSFRFHLPSSSYSAPAASDTGPDLVERTRRRLDDFGISAAVLNPGTAARISGFAYPDASNAIASATNDWLVAEWLDRDERFLGTMVVTTRDPLAAAAEIARVGRDARVVAVAVAYPQDLLAHRSHLPIFEAAVDCGLSVTLEAGGGFVGVNRGYTGAGHPASGYEFRVGTAFAAHAQVANVLAEGLFDRLPELRLTVCGSSISWLPALAAVMDAEYLAGGVDVALRQLPSEYLGTFVRFTMSAGDWGPGNRTAELLSTLPGSDLLLYGSGCDTTARSDPSALLDRLPAGWQAAVGARNALHHLQLPGSTTDVKATAHA